MRILHTSDWHIGKKLMGRERYDEYRAVLKEIDALCKSENIELLIVAGDVFDTYTPSAEAECIFFEGIKKISSHTAIVIISGNHDDSVRLTAPAVFLEECGVYIVGNQKRSFSKFPDFGVKCVSYGTGYAVFENSSGERVHLNLLPYPNEARFKEERSDESFSDKMSRWISLGEDGKEEGVPNIFVSHIFVAGGQVSDSEREIDVGGARAVPKSLLPECDYCALGHLHKKQNIGNAYYCGAPMQFSFDETGQEKSVNIFDITKDGINNFKQVILNSYRKLIRLQANSAEEGVKLLNANKEYFVELTLNLEEPLNLSQSYALHECENLISLKTDVALSVTGDETVSRRDKSSSELFCEYYELKYGTKPKDELLELFLTLTEEE